MYVKIWLLVESQKAENCKRMMPKDKKRLQVLPQEIEKKDRKMKQKGKRDH